MSRYMTSRELPEVLSLGDLAEWSGIPESALARRLADHGDVAPPDGVQAGRPFWMAATVLRWRPVPAPLAYALRPSTAELRA